MTDESQIPESGSEASDKPDAELESTPSPAEKPASAPESGGTGGFELPPERVEIGDLMEPPGTAPVDPQAVADAKAEKREKRLQQLKRERAARTRLIAIVVVVVLIAAAVVPFWLQSVTSRMNATKKLDQAIALAKTVDPVVNQVDVIVRAQIGTDTVVNAQSARDQIPAARSDLAKVVALVNAAYPKLNDDERRQAALLRQSAQARSAMLAAANPLLVVNIQAAKALPPMRDGWNQLLAAQKLAAVAALKYNTLKAPAVTASDAYLVASRSALFAADTAFRKAHKAFPKLSVSAYRGYTATRIALIGYARASNSAWLKKNPKLANSWSGKYNALDKKAAAAAAKLPATPEKAVAHAFDVATAKAAAAYAKARQAAQKAEDQLKAL